MKTILDLDDLYNIAGFMSEKGYTSAPITIIIDVLTKERMRNINKELFVESGKPESEFNPDETPEEIDVMVMGIRYKYRFVDYDAKNREQGADTGDKQV